jgi:hypothetical protein
MIALVMSVEEAKEMEFIYKVSSTGFYYKQKGIDAYNRMKHGDFTNTPIVKKENKESKKKNIEGYN